MIACEIEKKMIQSNGGRLYASPNKLRSITGFGSNKINSIVQDLDYIKDDKGKKFFIPDVAAELARLRKR